MLEISTSDEIKRTSQLVRENAQLRSKLSSDEANWLQITKKFGPEMLVLANNLSATNNCAAYKVDFPFSVYQFKPANERELSLKWQILSNLSFSKLGSKMEDFLITQQNAVVFFDNFNGTPVKLFIQNCLNLNLKANFVLTAFDLVQDQQLLIAILQRKSLQTLSNKMLQQILKLNLQELCYTTLLSMLKSALMDFQLNLVSWERLCLLFDIFIDFKATPELKLLAPQLVEFIKFSDSLPKRTKHSFDEIKNTDFPFLRTKSLQLLAVIIENDKQSVETVTKLGALQCVLNMCVIDLNNPFMKEAAILCINFLLKNNKKNQEYVAQLEERKNVDVNELAKSNFEVKFENGNLRH